MSNNCEVFPNPFNSHLFVIFRSGTRNYINIDLLTVDGKIVYSKSVGIASWQSRIELPDLGPLPDGIYTMRMTSGNKQVTKKLVKAKL